MKQFRIISEQGTDFGVYEGEDETEALDAMARDAGYNDQADAVARGAGMFAGQVVEVRGDLYDYNTGKCLRPATVPEAQASKDAARVDGGAGVITVDGVRCYVQE